MNEIKYGKYGRALLFYVVLFAGLLLEWTLFKSFVGISYTSWVGTLLKGAGDVALILLPYWLLPRRWRVGGVLPLWIFSVWSVVNLVYFRFWGDFIPPASVTMGGNFDGNLMEYGVSLLRWGYLLFLALPLVATIACCFLRPAKSDSFTIGYKTIFVISSILAGVAGQYSYIHTSNNWQNRIFKQSFQDALKHHYIGDCSEYKRNGYFN